MTERVLRVKDFIEDYLQLKGIEYETKTEIDINKNSYLITFITAFGWGFISDAHQDRVCFIAFDYLKYEKAEQENAQTDGKFYIYVSPFDFLTFLTSGEICY